MLAENLGDSYKPVQQYPIQNQLSIQCKEMDENDINKSTEFNAGKLKVVISLLLFAYLGSLFYFSLITKIIRSYTF